MTAPPSRSTLFGSPDHAISKSLFQQLFDYVVERLGGTVATASSAEKDEACVALGAVRTTQLYGTRNRLINGGFQVNQDNVSTAGDDVYCIDGWYVLTETGSVTVARQTDQENGTPFNIRLTQPDVTAKQVGLAQIIEAANCKDLRAKAATLAGRIRCSAAAQINYAVLEWTGTADVVTSDVISSWSGSPGYVANVTERIKGSVTPTAATWTDLPGVTAAINASTNNLIVLVWSNADLAQNATLDIGRMQLEPGSYATPFEHLPIGIAIQQCQRYFEVGSLDSDGAPGLKYANGSAGSWANSSHSFATRKRAAPTVAISGSISYDNCSSISFLSDESGFSSRVTVTAAGVYRAYGAVWVASARL